MDRLPDDVVRRILARLAGLETDPRPADVKKLKGREAWQIRVGDYRVIYEIHDRVLQVIVIILAILHQTKDGRTRVQCRSENETVRLTQVLRLVS